MKLSNFWVRLLVGIVIIALTVAALLTKVSFFYAYMAVVMVVALTEFFKITIGDRFHLQRVLASLAALALFAVVSQYFESGLSLRWLSLPLLLLLAVPVSFIFEKDCLQIDSISFLYTGVLYIGLPIAMSPVLVFNENGDFNGILLLCLIILIWVSDIGAYCVGSTLGHRPGAHKMAPSISPNKTWWGFAGSVLTAILVAIVLHYTDILDFAIVHCIMLGLITGSVCVAGDLVESLWKRHYGVKDSGKAIPGHGGMLDRIDSSLVAIPVAAIYLTLFNLI